MKTVYPLQTKFAGGINMQMGKQTDLNLLDFSKAFDKVAHEKLLLKLHHYGIRGDTLNGLRTFWIIENRPW